MKKKTFRNALIGILALASTMFLITGCGKEDKPEPKPADDDIKYDANLKMRYKVFEGEAEIVEIEKQGATLNIPDTIGGATVTRVSCTYTDKELTEVSLPASLTYFTGNGFMDCENLTTVTFASGSTIADIPSKAFLGTKLTSITIPASVRSISYEAFQNIDTLTSVTFESGSNLATIGPFAFYGCDGLTSISLPSNLQKIGDSAFEKCGKLSSISFTNATSLTNIDQYAFSGCEKITSLDFSKNTNLQVIGANSFRGCVSLESVKFNTSLKEIGNKAFYNTQKMTSLVLPENLTYVGDEAFVNAFNKDRTASIEIKSGSDTVFGTNAFSQYRLSGEKLIPLENIKSITINGGLSVDKVFTSYAPQMRKSLETIHVTGDKIAANAYKGCVNLQNLSIDTSIKAIGESAFEECIMITTVSLNEGLREISKNTFKNCVKLQTVNLPSSVTIVRSGAFDGCIKVANLELNNLIEIGSYAFRNTQIGTPTFSSKLVSIGEYAFDGCINVEEVVINTYTAGSSLKTNIETCAFTNCPNIVNIELSPNVSLAKSVFENDYNVVNVSVRGEYGLETLFGSSKDDVAKIIETITIADNTVTIEDRAFEGCLLVKEIIVPPTVKKIGDYAFKGCKGIDELILPPNLESIGIYAFADCIKLDISSLPTKIKEIGEGIFQNDATIGAFTLNSDTTKIGSFAFSGCSNLTIQLNNEITYIGESAFEGCLNLELTALPTSLTELGANAFSGCLLVSVAKTTPNLAKIGDYAFKGCKAITSFEFDHDLSENGKLGYAILEDCTKVANLSIYGTTSLQDLFGASVIELKPVLSAVTLKEGSTSLADNMFNGFTAIKSVDLKDIKKIGNSAFQDCISLTEIDILEVEEIGDSAFSGSGLAEVTLPANGLLIGKNVFANCTSLHACTINVSANEEENLTFIPEGTFQGTILVTIAIPDSITRIYDNAFSDILTLDSVIIETSSKLEMIQDNAFSGCSNLSEIFIPKGVERIGESAFEDCYALKTVLFDAANKLERIHASAFSNCYALSTINLPATIREISEHAFENCECLVKPTLPQTLEVLGESVFAGCLSINDIVIPEKVESIPDACFKNCYMLDTIQWNANIKTIGNEAFFNTPYKTVLPLTISFIGDSAFASEKDKPATFVGESLELGTGVSLTIGKEAFKLSQLDSVKLGAKIVEIGESAFADSMITTADLSDLKITRIADSMFANCQGLIEVDLTGNTTINTIGDFAFNKTAISDFPFDNIISIGESAFEEIEELTIKIELGTGENNVSIGSNAFHKSAITELVLGSNVIYIGDNAFSETDITSADLRGLAITSISESFFSNCSQLDDVKINSLIRTICANAFEGTAITDLTFLAPATDLEQIMESAFTNCTALTEATIPSKVAYVGSEAFSGCSNLESVDWSENCNVINDNTFQGCSALLYFTVKANVSRIGNGVFNAQGTETAPSIITFESNTPPSVDERFIASYDTTIVRVPSGKIATYQQNYIFKTFVTRIEEQA